MSDISSVERSSLASIARLIPADHPQLWNEDDLRAAAVRELRHTGHTDAVLRVYTVAAATAHEHGHTLRSCGAGAECRSCGAVMADSDALDFARTRDVDLLGAFARPCR